MQIIKIWNDLYSKIFGDGILVLYNFIIGNLFILRIEEKKIISLVFIDFDISLNSALGVDDLFCQMIDLALLLIYCQMVVNC